MNPNSGKVYNTLINKINNNLIKIIQEYMCLQKKCDIDQYFFLDKLEESTQYLKRDIDRYDRKYPIIIKKSTFGWYCQFVYLLD